MVNLSEAGSMALATALGFSLTFFIGIAILVNLSDLPGKSLTKACFGEECSAEDSSAWA